MTRPELSSLSAVDHETPVNGRVYSSVLQDFIGEAPLERRSIVEFVARAAATLPVGSRVADVGAGAAPYGELFAHTKYTTVDWANSLHTGSRPLDIVAPADDIPVPDGSFDAVICTQVLEHVPAPCKVLSEFARILVDGGRLYLTAPMVWEEHEMPYDYYRYTRSGLEFLAEQAGFERIAVVGRTDCFTTLGQLIASARWSLGDATDETAPARLAAFERLQEIASEVGQLAPLDAKQAFPLGYTVSAVRRSRPADAPAPSGTPQLEVADQPTKRTAVLYLAPWVDLGGSDKGTIDWFKSIDRGRWAPSLITTQPSANRWVPTLEPYADEVWELPELFPGHEFPGFVLDFIVSRDVEVVHIMNSRLAFDLLPDISALPDPPVVVVQLHAEEPDRSGYVRYAATRYGNLIDAYSVTSRQLADAMTDFDVPRSKLRVITTGVDALGVFNPEFVEPFDDLPGEGPRILWPGRVVAQKDPMLTLDVLKILVDRGVSYTLDLVGDGEMVDDVRARAEELEIADRICWHPPSHEMPRWYRSSDLLLMTSVFEGVPYVMYEALAMGVPVVVPAIPGNVEFLDVPDSGGVLIDPRDDAEAYADTLQRLLENDEERAGLGHQARERMLRTCSLEQMGAAHDALYDELLTARRAAARASRADRPSLDELPHVTFSRKTLPERTVGVIIPCYRHGRFLQQAIDSIHAQTLKAAQIVVVDDASPDVETIEALYTLDHDPLVKVIRLASNGGPSVARNRALAQIDANYVLPLDADDLLLEHALEYMVDQLEEAPDDVGFIYPNAQHFGNRRDYWVAPAFNLHLLMQGNFCPAATLFDRRVFEAGIAYPEHLVHGHEDWDVVLQMAAHGIHGQPADVPTFLYRKAGFSRFTSVEFAGEGHDESLERRHATLFRNRERIKGRWAPALSLVLADRVDGGEGTWRTEVLDDLVSQTFQDFEVVTTSTLARRGDDDPFVHRAGGAGLKQLAEAIQTARGRFVVVLGPSARGSLARPAFLEQVVRAFSSNPDLPHFALTPVLRVPSFKQLSAERIINATATGVAWRREPEVDLEPLEIEALETAIDEIVTGWELIAPIQWRNA